MRWRVRSVASGARRGSSVDLSTIVPACPNRAQRWDRCPRRAEKNSPRERGTLRGEWTPGPPGTRRERGVSCPVRTPESSFSGTAAADEQAEGGEGQARGGSAEGKRGAAAPVGAAGLDLDREGRGGLAHPGVARVRGHHLRRELDGVVAVRVRGEDGLPHVVGVRVGPVTADAGHADGVLTAADEPAGRAETVQL